MSFASNLRHADGTQNRTNAVSNVDWDTDTVDFAGAAAGNSSATPVACTGSMGIGQRRRQGALSVCARPMGHENLIRVARVECQCTQ